MSYALAMDVRPVALELHGLLRDLDPARWRDDFAAAARAKLLALHEQLHALWERAAHDERTVALAEPIGELASTLRERLPSDSLPPGELKDAWTSYGATLQKAYEALSASLAGSAVKLPDVRPTNYARSLAHLAISMVLLGLIHYVLRKDQLFVVPLCFAASFWTLELLRRYSDRWQTFLLWVFQHVAHPHERYQVNSSTWFGTALAVVGLTHDPLLCTIGVTVLGTADPAAALIGRHFGKHRLVRGRTLEGTLTFVVVGTAFGLGALSLWHQELALGHAVLVAFAGALVGGIAELFSRRVDDNFSIPISAAAGAWLMLTLLGL
jgi:dolichol kinase